MARNGSPDQTSYPHRRITTATIALWFFVALEAMGLGAAIWYMVGGVGSR
jgi:hypothetical protein